MTAVGRWGWLALGLTGACRATPPLAQAGDVAVLAGYSHPSVGGGAAAFVTLRNAGPLADTLRAVRLMDGPAASLHDTQASGGLARMTHMSVLVVPARTTVTMQSGGRHLMFGGVTRPMAPGDSCRLVLEFARAGTVSVTVPVVPFFETP